MKSSKSVSLDKHSDNGSSQISIKENHKENLI